MPPWAKFLRGIAPVVTQLLLASVEFFEEDADPAQSIWMRTSVKVENTVSLDPADDAYFSLDWLNVTAGGIDNSWDEGDFTKIEQELLTFVNVAQSWIDNSHKFTQVAFYQMAFNDYGDLRPFQDTGPPVRIFPLNQPGIGTAYQAPQVAMSVTEITSVRANWGRFYLPGLSPANMQSNGQFSPALVDAVLAATHGMYAACAASELYPVVPITSVDKVPTRGLLGVTEVQVDSVPDVIRRRRPKTAAYKARLGVPA